MGDPRKLRKKYSTPRHPWEAGRIAEEKQLVSAYGLKNKKEIYRIISIVEKYKYIARKLVGLPPAERKAEEEKLLAKLISSGALKTGATLDGVLMLKAEDFLERRLQTRVYKNGFSATIVQARQFITHGHISFKGRKVSIPGILIAAADEKEIGWHGKPIEFTVNKQPNLPAPIEAKKIEKAEEKKEEAKEGTEEKTKGKKETGEKQQKPGKPKKKREPKKAKTDAPVDRKEMISQIEDKALEKIDKV